LAPRAALSCLDARVPAGQRSNHLSHVFQVASRARKGARASHRALCWRVCLPRSDLIGVPVCSLSKGAAVLLLHELAPCMLTVCRQTPSVPCTDSLRGVSFRRLRRN